MYIPLEPVQSSMISQIGYHEKRQTLRIQFHDGAVYDYPMFVPRDWEAFRKADSLGKHFHRAIKPIFPHRRVEERELKEPCCDHPGKDTCDEECGPCDETCRCPSPKQESALDLLAQAERALMRALEIGLDCGLADDDLGAFSEANHALHALRELLGNGEDPVPDASSDKEGYPLTVERLSAEENCTCVCHEVLPVDSEGEENGPED